jgi:hypothetical protein
MKIEFAVLYEDRTWDTVIQDVPDVPGYDNPDLPNDAMYTAMEAWFRDNVLAKELVYRRAVMACIYNTDPEPDPEEEEPG